MLGFQPCLNV